MKFTLITILFFSFPVAGQLKDSCYKRFDEYGTREKILFTDSTFHYEIDNGFSIGSVRGNYSLSVDTVTLNSDFQPDDYKLTQTYDTTISMNSINIRIISIGDSNDINVRYRVDEHHLSLFPGQLISGARGNSLNEVHDTLTQLYEIPVSNNMQEVEVKILHSAPAIIIPISDSINSYTIDLTSYPNDLDYIFFNEQKLVVRHSHLYFLTEKNEVERYYKYIRSTRKGIKERKKVKKYVRCT